MQKLSTQPDCLADTAMTVFKRFTSNWLTGQPISGRRAGPEQWFSLGMALLAMAVAAYIGRAVFAAPTPVSYR